MSWPYNGYSVVNEQRYRECRKTQRLIIPIAKRIATNYPGTQIPIVNPKGIATSYVITNEYGTYHVKTDRHGYDTTRTEV